jgi:uncharacterized protein (TIGR02147 family)
MAKTSNESAKAEWSVFQYLDCQEFLRQAFLREKQRNPAFSHRYIARAMGSNSSSLFGEILTRKVKINSARALKLAKVFKLGRAETEYFETLVQYNQAEDESEKKRLLSRLLILSGAEKWPPLAAFQMEYFQKWYYAAIREILGVVPFRDDYRELGQMLEPPISAGEAMEAVQLLLNLGLIRKTAQGRFERRDQVVSSGSKADPAWVKPAIRHNLELALRALDQFPVEDRPFSYLTLSVSPAAMALIKEKLVRVRKEILDLVSADENVDRLYQLNMQLFPISKPADKRNP